MWVNDIESVHKPSQRMPVMDPADSYIRDLALKSVEVDYVAEGERGHATAFFFSHDEDLFLVTNQHVVREADDELRVHIRDSEDWFNTEPEDLALEHNGEPVWLTSNEHPAADIAVIPLDFSIEEIGNAAYSPDDFVEVFYRVNAGQSALVAGYPSWVRDRETRFPVIRDCRIATPFGHFYNEQPCFLTDARSHSGLSGSPVLVPGTDVGSSGGHVHLGDTGPNGEQIIELTNTMLLGVHSERINQPEEEYQAEGPLDLNRVWYIQLVEEIIESQG